MSFDKQVGKVIDKITGWGFKAFRLLPNFVVAVLVLIIFYYIAKLIRKVATRLMEQVTHNKTIIDLVDTIAGILVIAVGLFIALSVLQLSGAVTSLLAGAGVIGLALGFAFQDIAANFISGVFLSVRHPFGKGDIIECKDHYGTVQKINLRSTIIRTPQGQLVYIPNKDVYGDSLVNYTANFERRVDIDIGVSYADDHEKAKKLAIEAVEKLDNIDTDRDVELFYTGIGGSTFNYSIRFWVDFQKNQDFLSARSDAIVAIGKTYEENDIDMSYPIRTLDFGVKGGVKLNDMLEGFMTKKNGKDQSAEQDEE